MLTVRQIEMFRAVMITKTISGAARMLGTSQPGLSRMLAHMEDRLNFRRRPSGLYQSQSGIAPRDHRRDVRGDRPDHPALAPLRSART
ncbi:LysR family transcriptional regulator [Sphingobium sp.]|jgi:hypothetical protein|uniref:LysR family transcriptional regulator n=1 Tax=Sphingobium sp. TaxID=1912891 RepID=UPI002D802D9F|nr:LysR family transcriptional regulator [Sphingobium sp.]